MELVATFYAPGTVEPVARTIAGFGRGEAVVAVDAPSGPRLDLLAPGSPLRAELGLPDGRYERMRVCDALLFRRGLPLYPVPPPGQSRRRAGSSGSRVGLRAVRRARRPRRVPARTRRGLDRAASAPRRCASAGVCETYPTRSSARCSATARRRSARRGACSSGSPRCKLKGDRGRRRRAVAPHARRARRLRGRVRRVRARRRAAGCGSARPRRA